MIQVTPYGHDLFMGALVVHLDSVHLFVDNGELSGYGYAPVKLQPELWEGGVYPDILFELEKGEKERVMGYYVADDQGRVVYSENFGPSDDNDDSEAGFVIGRQGDRILVGLRLNLFMSQAPEDNVVQ